MRILTVGNLYPPHDHGGGYEFVWHSAVAALRRGGHDVRVLTTDHRVAGREDGAEPGLHRTLRWYWEANAFPRRTPWAELAIERHNAVQLRRLLAAFRPDVVAWWSMGGLSMSLLETVRRAGVPAVAFVHDDWLDYGRRTDAWHARLRQFPRGAGLASRVAGVPPRVDFAEAAHYAFVSRATRDHVWRTGLPVPSSSIVHSGIAESLLTPATPQPWGWRLLYVGRVDRRKGIRTAVRALAHLPPEASLTVVGSGEETELQRLRDDARDAGCADRVHLAGHRSLAELPGTYAAADVVVFPVEWQEPWGLVPLEAMACGRPVVATGRGGSAEYLRDGHNALLFPAGDARRLAERVTELADAPALRARLREAGLQTAHGHTDAVFNDGVEAALERAVARPRPVARPSEPTPPPRVSVVVAGTGDRTALDATVRCLSRQTAQGFEVVLAGDVAAEGDDDAAMPVRRVPAQGSGAAALEAGWRASGAPVVLFLAAGARPARGVVAAHLAHHARFPDPLVGVLGRVALQDARRTPPLGRWLFGRLHPAPPVTLGETGVLSFSTANGSLKRSALHAVDGFDAARFPRAGADLDLAYRLAERGGRLRFAEDAVVHVPVDGSPGAVARRWQDAADAERRFVALRPHWAPRLLPEAEAALAGRPGSGAAARLARWVPQRLPVVGAAVWRRARQHYTRALAPAVLAAGRTGGEPGPGMLAPPSTPPIPPEDA